MPRSKKSMDGNTAAAHVAYAFTEVAGIYPITPSSPMADQVDQWSALHQKNIFGTEVKVVEMQSEAGAAGTVHGSLAAGALTTTFTASQGLLLMIPNMYKIAGELLPAVFHVSARTVASHALNIFGDHSDVYACRQTGFAMLAESNPQEVMDLAAVAHLATLESRVPFINFFDGFRTSHEIQKIEVWDYDDLKEMTDMEAVKAFRAHALNPENPAMRGSHENGDIFFQHREACNKFYEAVPGIVEKYMGKVNAKLGTNYQLFEYYGASDADRVIIAMGSICDVAEEVIDYLTAKGEKVGLVKVRLYRPFAADKLLAAIPATAKKIAVLDRTKEPGALAEPLHLDVMAAFREAGREGTIIGGRYGLGSKDTPPSSVFAVYEELAKDAPKERFTLGINDDVTYLSLEEKPAPNTAAEGTVECKFWGLGGDGTVGANKNSTKIIGDHTDKYIQAYFQYDSKKTGGVTISHLRFGDKPIRAPYYINKADFVACHNPSYVIKGYKMVNDVKPGGVFMINCQWTPEELDHHMPAEAKRYIAKNNIQLYTINAIDKAIEIGLGKRTNTILQSAFFALAGVLPKEDALKFMKEAAYKSFAKKGDAIVEMNYKAIDAGFDAFVKIDVPASWADAKDAEGDHELAGNPATVKMVKEILFPVDKMDGDSLPVSAFVDHVDGQFEQGASAYEKRGVAVSVPEWDVTKCIQCNQCAYVCPHAVIRPFLATEAEAAASGVEWKQGLGETKEYKFRIQISPLDCTGCSNCVDVCPAKEKALVMRPLEEQMPQQKNWEYITRHIGYKQVVDKTKSVKNLQFAQPLFEFSGACAGCGETPYIKAISQLFGDKMMVANATGCTSIYSGSAPSTPYCTNDKGQGPAWANSLFEDNAEFGLGMHLGVEKLRDRIQARMEEAIANCTKCSDELKGVMKEWIAARGSSAKSAEVSARLVPMMEACGCDYCKDILEMKDWLVKKSQWIIGGDGWGYDIGFGGVDHVLASGADINILVVDTEVYSNTGGQSSKSTPVGAVAKFASAGKRIRKKDLGAIAMTYGYVYVAQVSIGASQMQLFNVLKEAEAYPGPSLVIAYAPCINHGIKGGMTRTQTVGKEAVACGYWHLWHYNPQLEEQGKNPFVLDSKEPDWSKFRDFLMKEVRYTSLKKSFPAEADELFAAAEENAKWRYNGYQRLAKMEY